MKTGTEIVDKVLDDVRSELLSAVDKFPRLYSDHEGYSVILEELDELWDDIKSKDATIEDKRKEAVQVAAMAVRFILDRCEITRV